MNKQEIYNSIKVGDFILLDPETVRSNWGKRWANNRWPVEIAQIGGGEKIHEKTVFSGVCSEDSSEGLRQFDASRVLSFADNLSQIKIESQRL